MRLERVCRAFDGQAVVALRDIDLSIDSGECVSIVGPSGSGKSTLINMMSGIDTPVSGMAYWRGEAIASRRRWAALRAGEIGIVFQEFNLLPTLSAVENVEMPMFGHGLSASERRRRAGAALDRVGLGGRLAHLPYQLSGGERQRVAIARSIVNRPVLLLADEPTGNLDRANAALVADLLLELGQAGDTTLVIVTHDVALAARCRRLVQLRDGTIVDDRARAALAPPALDEIVVEPRA